MLDFSKNHFELFGLPAGFAVDMAELGRRYRDLQRAMHPDRYAAGSDRERRLSLQGASRINEAFETLKDPLLRSRYLLSLYGIDMEAQGGNIADAGFLMEQMELREELEASRHQPDPYRAIAEFVAGISGRIQALLELVAEQFDKATPEALGEVQELLRKLQFLQKLLSQAEGLESELDEAL